MENIKEILTEISQNSDCIKLKVGAIIVKDNKIISKGYNKALGKEKCLEHFKNKSLEEKQLFHSAWSDCYEIHAEAMAICECAKQGISLNDSVLYVTHSPCMECAKLIVFSGISKVYYKIKYKNGEGLRLLKERGISCEQI